MSSSGSVLNGCPQHNSVVFGLEVQQTTPNNYLNILNTYSESSESFHNPFSDYRFPKALVRVIYPQEHEQSEPLGLSDRTKAQQQSDENTLYTSQSGLIIDHVWDMALEADSQSHSVNINHPPLDSTLKDTAGNIFSGMGQSTPKISSVIDNNLHQLVPIPDQNRIATFSRPEAPIAMIIPQLHSEQLQQNTSSKNEFDFNFSASVSGEFLTISLDKASQKAYLEPEKGKAYEQSEKRKAYQKAYQKAYRESEKGKATRKAYLESDKGKATREAYRKSEKGKTSQKAYQKAYRKSEKGKTSRKAYEQSEKRKAYQKAYQKAYRESKKGKDYQKAYQKAYYKILKNTGDKEQAKIAGKQASTFIRGSDEARNSELKSISIYPLPSPPLWLTGK
ncbi:hypothetical protein [Endozoicomonas sp. SCSIO W0465]|uniref:hypothetical protein n=1 Tax=Endozoicomonas sp. SCSIO W0465 TaxID=2918516 RepID=UPI0020751C31|nr:hypothetical protein [Endozoicomonas sp. SCSIO W0465]USE38966.1 hypothetical protein MJO57_12845 [Endozoicomonas sp. SCSIO W0465]